MNVEIEASAPVDLSGLISRTAYANVFGSEGKLEQWIQDSTTVWAGKVRGEIVCVWGVRAPTLLSDTAYLWLLTTDDLAEYKFLFIRHSQLAIKVLLEEYRVIKGHYKSGDPRARRWLEWLGARFDEPVNDIYPFTIVKRHG